ncbi:hypothetical protein W04_2488 [Pseudoalteromonas sp. SW0106-04]|nr:hypothetical protein W04_2488 [Pseudoalteromonas sp. SW0106-04]
MIKCAQQSSTDLVMQVLHAGASTHHSRQVLTGFDVALGN